MTKILYTCYNDKCEGGLSTDILKDIVYMHVNTCDIAFYDKDDNIVKVIPLPQHVKRNRYNEKEHINITLK